MGGQQSMVALIKHLDRTKFRPLGVTSMAGELTERLVELGCPVYHIPLGPISTNTWRQVRKNIASFRRLYREHNVRIVHPDAERDVVVCGLAKTGLPVELVWHVRITGSNKLDPIVVRLADRIIGVSKGVQERFPSKRLKGKYRTIYNGVDLTRFHPVDDARGLRLKLGLPVERSILLFAGQIKREKGIFELVEAMRLLSQRRQRNAMPFLVMMGTPVRASMLHELQDMIAEDEIGNNIILKEHQRNVEEWMAAADILLLPSHSEGMGRVIFEGMACGAVPIASDIPGVREAITSESGLLVPEKNPLALADAIESLLDDTLLYTSLKKEGAERARNVFDARIHARNVEEFYREMVGDKFT